MNEKFNIEKKRDELAEKVKNEPDHEKRHEILNDAKDFNFVDSYRTDSNDELRGDFRKNLQEYNNNKELFNKEYEVSVDSPEIMKELNSDDKIRFEQMKNFSKRVGYLEQPKFLAKLFFLPDTEEFEDLVKKFRGYSMATLEQLLAFLQNHPEFKKYPIIALNSYYTFADTTYDPNNKVSFKSSGDRSTLMTHEDKSGNLTIDSTCCEDCCIKKNSKKYYFLGVKSDNKNQAEEKTS